MGCKTIKGICRMLSLTCDMMEKANFTRYTSNREDTGVGSGRIR